MNLRLAAFVALFLSFASSAAAQGALWIRYPVISPNGQWIAFSYGGDLWVAPVTPEGGVSATLLTTHEGYERSPVWSPDSKAIAFAADWHGQLDVYVTSIARSPAKRLTYHSSTDVPTSFTPDGKSVLFSSSRVDAPAARIGTTFLPELYQVSLDGGTPTQVLTTAAEDASYNPSMSHLLYQDRKGYENEWRKHHVSSVTRDVWLFEKETGKHTKLTDFRGEDRNPVWLPNGEEFVFLSERGGSLNIWQASVDKPGKSRSLTQHALHPCRFLSVSNDGTLAYTYKGQVWLKRGDSAPAPYSIEANLDERTNNVSVETLTKGATEIALSPGGDEVAFVVRGEVFAASIDHGTTRRLTHTPEQERSITWAKDGRTIYFAGEREDSWNLYKVSLSREEEEFFSLATILKEEPVLVSDDETFQPVASPDGNWLAYVHNRDAIRVLNLKTNESKEIVSADLNYSYSDGDIDFSWSPDSAWLAFNYMPGQRWGSDVGVASIESGEILNVTLTGYNEGSAEWSPAGDALLFASGRFGRQEHSGRGSDQDVMAVYLTQKAYDRAILSKEDFELLKKREEKDKKKKKEAAKESKKSGDEDDQVASADEKKGDEKKSDEEKTKPVVIEADGFEKRIRRLTLHSVRTGDYQLTPDGESLIFLARVDGK